MSNIILHGVSASPYVRKVRIVLEEKQIPYELVHVMPGAIPPEFRRKSLLGKVPVLEHGDLVLPDSSVICAYLERIHPEPSFYPGSPGVYARGLWYEEYADSRLVEVGTPVFFQRVVQALLFKQPSNEEIVTRCIEELIPPTFDYLENELAHEGSFAGEAFSIADVAICSPLINLLHADVLIDPSQWPRLTAWFERVCERPIVARIIEEERAAFSAY